MKIHLAGRRNGLSLFIVTPAPAYAFPPRMASISSFARSTRTS